MCNCGEDYIGETERQFKQRLCEHKRPSSVGKSVMATHVQTEGHAVDDNIRFYGQESDWARRGVKESIEIRRHRPSLNRDEGRHQLPHIWDTLLHKGESQH